MSQQQGSTKSHFLIYFLGKLEKINSSDPHLWSDVHKKAISPFITDPKYRKQQKKLDGKTITDEEDWLNEREEGLLPIL
jgi:hypothetical protein